MTAPRPGWRGTLYEVIFESDTPAGKWFDVALILSIVASVVVVMLDSVASLNARHGRLLHTLEWVFTALFTVEYALRLVSAVRPLHYAASFFGVVDLLSILPTYLSLIIAGSQYLLVIRVIRILRVFRVLKLMTYLGEAELLMQALWASRRKITVFVFAVLTLVIIFGSLMYVIEGERNGFSSIPRSIYWAIVTLTTVGYGDISPRTDIGQAVAAVIMIMGYGIIAVPTGIVTAELTHAAVMARDERPCPGCGRVGHDRGAAYCDRCGAGLARPEP